MTMYVLIENKPEGTITASLIGWPHIQAQGNTEDEAVRHLRSSLSARLKKAKVIPLELNMEQPWMQTAGLFLNDSFADELNALIADYRATLDGDETAPCESQATT